MTTVNTVKNLLFELDMWCYTNNTLAFILFLENNIFCVWFDKKII